MLIELEEVVDVLCLRKVVVFRSPVRCAAPQSWNFNVSSKISKVNSVSC